MNSTELSPVEKAFVEQHRLSNEIEARRANSEMEVIKVAYDFARWRASSGMAINCSVLLDDFGYKGEIEPRFLVAAIEDIITAARRAVTNG